MSDIGLPGMDGLTSPVFADVPSKPRREKGDVVKSVAFAACPTCSNNKIGLVRQGAHLAYRDHNYRTHGGVSMQCRSVGQHLCDMPARDASQFTGDQPPICPCSQ